MSDLLLLSEVAKRLRCSVSTVKQHIARGRIAAIDLGSGTRKHYRITESALKDFQNSAPEPAASLPRRTELSIHASSRFMKRLGHY